MSQLMRAVLLVIIVLSISSCCDEGSIPKFKQQLYSSTPRVRNDAALDLARCGENASGAVPRLAELLYDPNVGVQSAAAYALRKIDTENARASLERAEARRREMKSR